MRKSGTCKGQKPGKQYEEIVANIYRQFAGTAQVIENEQILGKSGQTRQIDVSIRTSVVGNPILLVVECKDYHRRVGIDKVDELIGKIDDVGADQGVLVSDTGFSSDAIGRAKANGRIHLVSVVDTQNSYLRSRIYLPVQVSFHKLEYPFQQVGFKIERFPEHPLNLVDVDEQKRNVLFSQELQEAVQCQALRLVENFYVWCEENAGSLKAGTHEYVETLVNTPERKIVGRCVFNKSIRHFVNENIFAEGVGIYDHITQVIVQGDDLKRVVINEQEVLDTWREVQENYKLKDCRNYYARVDTYNIDSAEEMARNIIKGAVTPT